MELFLFLNLYLASNLDGFAFFLDFGTFAHVFLGLRALLHSHILYTMSVPAVCIEL